MRGDTSLCRSLTVHSAVRHAQTVAGGVCCARRPPRSAGHLASLLRRPQKCCTVLWWQCASAFPKAAPFWLHYPFCLLPACAVLSLPLTAPGLSCMPVRASCSVLCDTATGRLARNSTVRRRRAQPPGFDRARHRRWPRSILYNLCSAFLLLSVLESRQLSGPPAAWHAPRPPSTPTSPCTRPRC